MVADLVVDVVSVAEMDLIAHVDSVAEGFRLKAWTHLQTRMIPEFVEVRRLVTKLENAAMQQFQRQR